MSATPERQHLLAAVPQHRAGRLVDVEEAGRRDRPRTRPRRPGRAGTGEAQRLLGLHGIPRSGGIFQQKRTHWAIPSPGLKATDSGPVIISSADPFRRCDLLHAVSLESAGQANSKICVIMHIKALSGVCRTEPGPRSGRVGTPPRRGRTAWPVFQASPRKVISFFPPRRPAGAFPLEAPRGPPAALYLEDVADQFRKLQAARRPGPGPGAGRGPLRHPGPGVEQPGHADPAHGGQPDLPLDRLPDHRRREARPRPRLRVRGEGRQPPGRTSWPAGRRDGAASSRRSPRSPRRT